MDSHYNYYKDTLSEIEEKIQTATNAFSGSDDSFYAIPKYDKEKKILTVRVQNLSDDSSFTIFQKLGNSFGIKVYNENNEEEYEYYQTINANQKKSFLYYEPTHKVGIYEESQKTSDTGTFIPTEIKETFPDENANLIKFRCTPLNNQNVKINDSTYYKIETNSIDVLGLNVEERSAKALEMVSYYYILSSNSINKKIVDFNKTLKSFIENLGHNSGDLKPDKENHEDR